MLEGPAEDQVYTEHNYYTAFSRITKITSYQDQDLEIRRFASI